MLSSLEQLSLSIVVETIVVLGIKMETVMEIAMEVDMEAIMDQVIVKEVDTNVVAIMDVSTSSYYYCLLKCFSLDKKILCPKIPAPANGDVKVDGRYPGDKAVYKCNVGYVLVGLDTRKCLSDGKWSGEAPICKR